MDTRIATDDLKDIAKVKMVFFDFDGVFTDNRVMVSEDGRESVLCYRSDGVGLFKIKALGLECMVISAETNPVVARRCEKLGINYIQDCKDKLKVLVRVSDQKNIDLEKCAFVGNDLGDIECMQSVGFPIAVSDAYPEVKQIACLITEREGGKGAVREICDLIVDAYAIDE